MKLVVQIAAGIILAMFVVFFLIGWAEHSDNSAGAVTSNTPSADSVALSCNDYAVTTAVADNLAEWLNQKIIVHGSGADLHLNGKLLTQVSTSVSVGQLQDTQQCLANVSIGFKDTAGTLHSAEPVSIRFDVAAESDDTPKITFNEASLLEDGGAYDATASLLVAEDQRETGP